MLTTGRRASSTKASTDAIMSQHREHKYRYALRNYAECGPVFDHSRCPAGRVSARSERLKRRHFSLAALFRHLQYSNTLTQHVDMCWRVLAVSGS